MYALSLHSISTLLEQKLMYRQKLTTLSAPNPNHENGSTGTGKGAETKGIANQ